MRITEVSAHAVDIGQGFAWGGRVPMNVIGVLVCIHTDGDAVGYGLAATGDLPAAVVAAAVRSNLAPALLGEDPHDRPRLLTRAWRAFRVGLPLPAIGVVDVALWDLAGKAAGVSVSQLLGRERDRMKGCVSAPPVADVADAEAMVGELAEAGFRAIKLHACGDVNIDRAVYRAARDVLGGEVELMMDAMAIYDRVHTRQLAHTLDECGFRWFEDPLRDDDLDGWKELRRACATPLAGVDALRFSTRDYARPMADGAFDNVRMDAARHGISQLDALGRVAEAFGLGCEGHASGPALAQAANLHAGLAARTARYCELPVPLGALDHGAVAGLRLDADGYVHAPAGPGLGLEVDLAALEDARIP
jgi:L-alanine-DL-glutamate epimerase-like enolase superfamily enzyme